MNYKLIILILSFTTVTIGHAQTDNEHHSTEEKPVYEIITSGIYSYLFEEDEGSFGTEIHFTYWFDHTWGGGISYTAKFEDEETLHDVALLGSVNPTSWLTVNAGPNFGFSGEERDFEASAYIETEINIRPTKWFHFGPVIGTLLGENSELLTGFHLGFELY